MTVPGSVGPLSADVKKEEHLLTIDIILPIFCISKSICLYHDNLQSKVTPRSLVSYTCSTAKLFRTRFSGGLELNVCFVPNTMLLVLDMFRTRSLSENYLNTICNSLLGAEVISSTVCADI